MRVVELRSDTYEKILSEAERILRSGGLVIGPTDTVYGIFADATNEHAMAKIFSLKQRIPEKALPIFVRDMHKARKYAYISDTKMQFLEKVWPGSVTVIFHHKEKLPLILTGGLDTIGIRIPNHPFLLELLARLEFPLAQTSANISGESPARDIDEIAAYFKMHEMKPDLVIDGGRIEGKSSAVVDFTSDQPILLRTGILTKSSFDEFLQSVV